MKRDGRYRRVERHLNLIALVANGCGAALITFYFSNIHREGVQGIAGGSLVGLVIEGVIFVALFPLGHFLSGRLITPMLAWYRQNADNPEPELAPLRVRQLALGLPATSAGTSLAIWFLAGLMFGLIESFDIGARQFDWTLFTQILLGTVIAGFVTAVIIYFSVERIWRSELPRFFAGDDLTKTLAFRLKVRARMLILFVIAVAPLLDLAALSYGQAAQIASAPQPVALLPRLLRLELFLVGVGLLTAVVLARTLGASLVGPLEMLSQRMRAVEEGDMDARMAVTSNDEIGVMSQCFNGMVGSLKRRDVELRTIYQISQDIAASLELDQTLRMVLEQVRQMIAYAGAEICLHDQQENVLHMRARAGREGIETGVEGRSYRLGEGCTGWVGEQRRSLLVADVDALAEQKPVDRRLADLQIADRQIADGLALDSYLGAPLLAGQKLVGTLALFGAGKGAFSEHARQLLETIAPPAAIAIENAAQVLERERRLKEQIEQLRIQIDEAKRARQVAEVTETDYFQRLQQKAREMREAPEG